MILLENGTGCNAEACGVEVHYRDDTAPVAGRPVLDSLAKVGDLQVPDPYVTFPMSEILKATRILAREIGDKAWISARADQGPMDLAAQLRGMSEFMMDLATGEEEELIHALLDYARRVATRYAYALIECGGRSTSIGEPMAGPAMISPRHYRRYPWAHERRMVAELKDHGIILHLHICGDTERITEDFISTGAQVLEIDHKTDAARLKAQSAGQDVPAWQYRHEPSRTRDGRRSCRVLPRAHRDLQARRRLHPRPGMCHGPDHPGREHSCTRRVSKKVRLIPQQVNAVLGCCRCGWCRRTDQKAFCEYSDICAWHCGPLF